MYIYCNCIKCNNPYRMNNMIYINLVTVSYCGADLFFSLSLLKAVTFPRIFILRSELCSTQMACHVNPQVTVTVKG